jgi:hypothetical protein
VKQNEEKLKPRFAGAGITESGYNVSTLSASRNSRGVSTRSNVDRIASSFTNRASVPTQIR